MASSLPSPRGVPVGTWNHLIVTLGQRGMGKSTWQCARARELAQEAGGAYVIGHSLGGRLPKRLPEVYGGGELPISYHTTIAELDRELHRHPERWHILAPPIVGSDVETLQRETCDDLIRYSMKLSQSIRDAAYKREYPTARLPQLFKRKARVRDYDGLYAIPIILLVDEGVAIDSASTGQRSKGADKWFLEWIYSLRHMHTALLYAIQNPTARNWQLISERTECTCFCIKHDWATNAIRAAGGTAYEIACVKSLDKHEYVRLDDDEGPIGWDDEDDEIEIEVSENRTPELEVDGGETPPSTPMGDPVSSAATDEIPKPPPV